MRCLRCGYCCVNYDVIIIDDDVEKEYEDAPYGISHKPSGIPCKHLRFNTDGNAQCLLHDDPRYESTPCAGFTQIGALDAFCRIGEGVRKGIVPMKVIEVTSV